MASIDSCLASPMKPQVLTTMTSASSGAPTTWWPAPAVWPSMTSVSTRFLGQPSETKWTFMARKPANLARGRARCSGDGQSETELGAGPGLRRPPDAPAVGLDDPLRDV